MVNMTPSTFPVWKILTIGLIVVVSAADQTLSESQQEPAESLNEQSETSLGSKPTAAENETPSNRVLPVDAEHKNKISFPQQPLDPICVKTMRDNLIKFLKRVKRSGTRKGRQDDGDDGDDGDEGGGGGGVAGLFAGLGEGNGALSTLAAVPALFPSLVTTLTQTVGAANQALNGTDTPNLPSFFAKQASDAVKFFQAFNMGNKSPPSSPIIPPNLHVQRIPGGPVTRKPRPEINLPNDEYPNDPDYPDEEVKQPPQPVLKPLGGGGSGQPNYEPIPGSSGSINTNQFLQNADIRNPSQASSPAAAAGATGDANKGLQKTSLWQIYKSFRTRNGGTGTLTDFQLAHPEAFSNELLHSISQSIANVREQGTNQVPPEIPSSEIFKHFYPSAKPLLLGNGNRPGLSVYKPSGSASGVGIDLNNLALNASNNDNSFYNQEEPEQEQTTEPPSTNQQNELESPDVSPGHPVPGGSGGLTYETLQQLLNLNQGQLGTDSGVGFGSISSENKPLLEPEPEVNNNVNPTLPSSQLAIPLPGYLPAVSSLYEEELQTKVGPQSTWQDSMNGFKTKTPYTPVNNGILYTAPRLTPSPYLNLKRPSGITVNLGDPTQTTETPEADFSYQFSNSGPGLLPPGASSRPVNPNASRAPAVSAAITSNFLQQSNQNLFQGPSNNFQRPSNGVVPPSWIKPAHIPESEKVVVSSSSPPMAPSPAISEQEIAPVSTGNQSPVIEEDIEVHPETDHNRNPTGSGRPPLVNAIQENPAEKKNGSVGALFALYQKLISEQATLQQQQLQTRPVSETKEPVAVNPPSSGISGSIFRLPQQTGSSSSFGSSLIQNIRKPQQQAENTKPSYQSPSVTSNLNFPQFGNLVGGSNAEEGLSNPENDNEGLISSSNKPSYEIQPDPTLSASPVASGSFSNSLFSSAALNQLASLQSQGQKQRPAGTSDSQPQLANFYPFPQFSKKPEDASQANLQPSAVGASDQHTGSVSSSSPFVEQNAQPSFSQNLGGAGISSYPQFANNVGGANQNHLQNVQPVFPANHETLNHESGEADISSPTETLQVESTTSTTGPIESTASSNSNGDLPFIYPSFAAASPQFSIPSGLYPQKVGQQPEKNVGSNLNSPVISSQPNQNGQVNQSPLDNSPAQSNIQPSPEVPPKNSIIESSQSQPNYEIPSIAQNFNNRPLGVESFAPGISSAGVSSSSAAQQQQPIQNSQPFIVGSSGVQNGGYPSHAPLGRPSGSQNPLYGSDIAVSPLGTGLQAIPSPAVNNIPENLFTANQNKLQVNTLAQQTHQSGHINVPPKSTISEKNPPPHIPHAIAEMSKLPFYQEESFRPSALPPQFVSGNDDDSSMEQPGSGNKKQSIFSEIFSNITQEADKNPTTIITTSAPPKSANNVGEEDYGEPSNVPNFPPGKPAYWMNMYYPNGIPVLTKVRPPRPVRRRPRPTPPGFPPPLPPGPGAGPDYDEDEDEDAAKKRKKAP